MSKANFVIRRSKDKQYYWVFVASNGEDICTTEMYTTKQSAKHSIDLIQKEARDAGIIDVSDHD
jgi:hypothetical protein